MVGVNLLNYSIVKCVFVYTTAVLHTILKVATPRGDSLCLRRGKSMILEVGGGGGGSI